MFTVKFLSFHNSLYLQTSISCPHYDAYKHSDGAYSVTCYKDLTSLEGVERRVQRDPENGQQPSSEEPPYYHVCYVENQAGKTIDTFKP